MLRSARRALPATARAMRPSVGARAMSAVTIPGPPEAGELACIPFMMEHGGPTKRDEVLCAAYEQFGDVVQYNMPGLKQVLVFDPEDMMKVHRSAGKFPNAPVNAVWPISIAMQQVSNSKNLWSLKDGQEWKDGRHKAQKGLFNPVEAEAYTAVFVPVVHDAFESLKQCKDGQEFELCMNRTTFELIAAALFNERMNAVGPNINHENLGFVDDTVAVFGKAGDMLFSGKPPDQVLGTPEWDDYQATFNRTMETATRHVDRVSSATRAGTLDKIDPSVTSYLEQHLGMDSLDELVGHTAALLFAGVDTTARTLILNLIYLAENPEAQDKLHEEVARVLGDEPFSRAKMKELPYLKACIREAHRLTGGGLSRILPEDVTLANGMTVPAGTQLAFSSSPKSRDPSVFPEPEAFKPERWLDPEVRDDKKLRNHRLMATPFSAGPRMCLGARLAEIEMRVFLSELVRKYRLRSTTPGQWELGNLLLPQAFPAQHIVLEER